MRIPRKKVAAVSVEEAVTNILAVLKTLPMDKASRVLHTCRLTLMLEGMKTP